MKSAIICPTFNPSQFAEDWLNAFNRQTVKPEFRLIIDSSPLQDDARIFSESGFNVQRISQREFDHALTRQMAIDEFPEAEIMIFCTQDAIFADDLAIENLLKPFDDPDVAAACGRQIPHDNATPIARHARVFNYSATSFVRSKEDIPRCGIKTAFLSNSFAAYRQSALRDIGGFQGPSIHAEDMAAAARLILAGYKIAYAADAEVKHSHNYSILQECQRYFDTGVFHARNPWLLEAFGGVGGEGSRFAISELTYLLKHAPWLLPIAPVRLLLKFAAFHLGKKEHILPIKLKRLFSMNRKFWDRERRR